MKFSAINSNAIELIYLNADYEMRPFRLQFRITLEHASLLGISARDANAEDA